MFTDNKSLPENHILAESSTCLRQAEVAEQTRHREHLWSCMVQTEPLLLPQGRLGMQCKLPLEEETRTPPL